MATTQIPAEEQLKFYGTNQINECIKIGGGITPIQVLGLVPCDTNIFKFSCDSKGSSEAGALIDNSNDYLIDNTGGKLIDNTGTNGGIIRDPEWRNNFCLPTFSGRKNAFLFEYPSLDTPEDFRLFKYDYPSGNYLEVVSLTDDSFGKLYPLNGFDDYPEYAGFNLDWGIVFGAFGAGDYIFSAYNAAVPDNSLFSYNFKLQDNIDNYRNGTVYIEIQSQGLFDNPMYSSKNGIRRQWDLELLDWEDSCTYKGKLEPVEFEKETSYIRSVKNNNSIYYSDKTQIYNLNIFDTTFNLFQRLEFYGLNSYDITITDDNRDSVSNFFEKIEVIDSDSTTFTTNPTYRKLVEATIQLKNKHQQNFRPR